MCLDNTMIDFKAEDAYFVPVRLIGCGMAFLLSEGRAEAWLAARNGRQTERHFAIMSESPDARIIIYQPTMAPAAD